MALTRHPYDRLHSRGAMVDAARLQNRFNGAGIPLAEPAYPGAIYTPGSSPLPQGNKVVSKYGDMQSLTVNLVNNVDSLVLSRPSGTRVFMLIYNANAANLYFAFDQQANASSLPIPPGGNLFFDNAVPQNDVHLFYIGANVAVPILYINT